MRLKEWAARQGVHCQTAYRWFREGTLPVPARKVGRLILVDIDGSANILPAPQTAAVYARVSGSDQSADLG